MQVLRAALVPVLLASLILLVAGSLAGHGPPAAISIFSVYALFGVSSLAAQYAVSSAPARRRAVVAGAVSVAAAAAGGLLAIEAAPLRTLARVGLIVAGIAGLAGYAWDAAAASGDARRHALVELRDALVLPLAVMQVPFFLWATTGINPVVDAHVLAFEAVLGVDVTALAHRAFAAVPVADLLALGCYYALPVGLAAAAAIQPDADARLRVMLTAIASGAAGFALYTVAPVVGIFQAFPDQVPPAALVDPAPMTIAAWVPRNGMPSLHTAWALVIAFSARRLRRAPRAALWTFAGLNIWTAAGGVDHWVMDIVVGVPLAAGVYLAVAPSPRRAARWAGAGGCLALTILWTASFRTGVPLADAPAWMAWSAVALTVVGPLWVVRMAAHAPRTT